MQLKALAVAVSAVCAAALVNPAHAVDFNNTIFFGDSLTDSGSYGARFTTNPGMVWAQILAAKLGTTAAPNLGAGGTDYAEGGARVTQVPGIGYPQVPATPVSQQIDAYLGAGGGRADPNALYTVWAGANDIFTQAGLAGAGAITPAQAQAGVLQAAKDLVTQVQRLQTAGARYILVPNIPDIGSTPFGQASGAAATFTAFSQLYNATMAAGLASTGMPVIALNTYKLDQEILATPLQFGITNITSTACTTSSSLMCTPATLVSPNAPLTYAFADSVHPTTAGHIILADYAYSVLEAPSQIGMLAEAPLHASEAQRYAIDNRMRQPLAGRAVGSFESFVNLDYQPVRIDINNNSAGLSSDNQNVTIGVDMQVTDRILAGLALGYSDENNDFGANGGGFHQAFTSVTAYGAARVGGSSYLSALATVGNINYDNVHRDIPLGVATRTESGSTSGNYSALRIGGGMDVAYGQWSIGPLANLTWQKVGVDSFSENGTNSTSMAFGSQTRKALTGSMGARTSYAMQSPLGELRPYAQLTYEHEFDNDTRYVTANVIGMPGSFSLPAYLPDRNYALLGAGLMAQLSKAVSAVISLNSVLMQKDAHSTAVGVNFRFHF
jgi:outer membrane lipase/esterase